MVGFYHSVRPTKDSLAATRALAAGREHVGRVLSHLQIGGCHSTRMGRGSAACEKHGDNRMSFGIQTSTRCTELTGRTPRAFWDSPRCPASVTN